MYKRQGEWPVVLTRHRTGDIKAFHNTCRHRGSRICKPGKGAAARLVCPYHRWTYDLSGELAHAPRMGDDFDVSDHRLAPVHIQNVGGALYVCLANDPPPLDDFAAALEPMLAPHNLSHAKLAFESTLIERGNWKLVMENARECYHCATSHPELSRAFPTFVKAHFDFGEDPAQIHFAERLAAAGLPTGTFDGEGWQISRFMLNAPVKTFSMDGEFSVKRLMCDVEGGDIGSLRWANDPNNFVHATADQLVMFQVMPVGPRESVVTTKWLVHEDAVEGVDYDIESLTRLWTLTNLQDRDLVENNQAGVNSPAYVPGPYSTEAEALAISFADWYCAKARDFLARPGAGMSGS